MPIIIAPHTSESLCKNCFNWTSNHADDKCLYEHSYFTPVRCLWCDGIIHGLANYGVHENTYAFLDSACFMRIGEAMQMPLLATTQERIDWIHKL